MFCRPFRKEVLVPAHHKRVSLLTVTHNRHALFTVFINLLQFCSALEGTCVTIFSGGCEVVCPLLFSIHQLCPGCNLHIKLILFIHWELPDPPKPTAAQQHLNIWTATTPECSGQAWYTVMTLLINVMIVMNSHKIQMLAKMTRDTVPH